MKNLSNVGICLTKRDMKILKDTLKRVNSNLLNVCDSINEFVGEDGLRYVFMSWKNIEWFIGYVDIWFIESMLIDFKQKNIPFNFIRIGRNNDVDHKFCYDTKYIIDTGMIMQMLMSFKSRRS